MFSPKNLIFLLSTLLLNCQESVESDVPGDITPKEKRYFVSATAGQEISRTTLQFLAGGFGQPEVASLLRYDVATYTVTYYTTFKGKQIEASGLIMLPKGMTVDAPIVSLQHGTTFLKDEAPSVRGGFQGLELL